MAGGKKKGNGGKPVNQRKAFKDSAAYRKPTTVSPHEKPGSPYRQKLRDRQAEARADSGTPKFRW